MKKLFLIPLLACFFCINSFAGNGIEKFYLGVSAGNTVSASVYDGLNLQLQLPADGTLDMSSVTVEVRMQDVPALGVTSPRSHAVTVETGLEGTVNFTSWLNNAYDFDGTLLKVFVNEEEGESQSFQFNFKAIENGIIEANPNDEEAALAAWNLLASHVASTTQAGDDSYVLVKEGSFIQFGGEKLIFTSDLELLKGNWQSDGLEGAVQKVRDAVVLNDAEEGNVIFIADGSVLAVGESLATLNNDVTITLTNDNADDPFAGFLSDLRAKVQNNEVADAIKGVVTLCNDFVGYIDAAEENTLTIDIAKKSPTGIDEISLSTKGAQKLIRNGQLVIIRDGVAYNAQGAVIK